MTSEWIPVTSPPSLIRDMDVLFDEQSDYVLLWVDGEIRIGSLCKWDDEDDVVWYSDGEGWQLNPAYWMPLPSPPKE
jgi:hypothetical protein